MKILIADDEALARRRLRGLCEALPDCEVMAEAADGLEVLRRCERQTPDLVLLDIRMPGMDGLEVAHHLSRLSRPPAVVFTTAYDEHALAAFEAQAVDYLLKPVRGERLQQALDKARRLNPAQLDGLAGTAPQKARRNYISVQIGGQLELIPVNDILFFQAGDKYVTVHYRGGEQVIEESLKSLQQELGERFIRVHRNALVAKDAIEALERRPVGRHVVRLRGDETRLEVSRRQLPDVKDWLKRRER